MQMNLKTTITAYPKLSPSILNNYVAEAPIDGKTYARRNGQWVDILPSDILVLTGYSHFNIITSNPMFDSEDTDYIFDLKDIQYNSLNIATKKETINIEIPKDDHGYCWICSTVPLNSITVDFGAGEMTIDYSKQKNNMVVTIPSNSGTPFSGEQVTFYCYMTEDLTDNNWKFNLYLPLTSSL